MVRRLHHVFFYGGGGVVAAVTLALLSQDAPSSVAGNPAKQIDLAAYTLTFDENFDALDVSPWGPNTRWIAHTPWNGDFGDAHFSDPKPGFPFTVKDSVLRIEARLGDDGKWRSGLLASSDPKGKGFLQKFGYFEMRAKLPAGPGLWPAFWLIGNQQPDTSAEIDVMEHYGKFPGMYESVVHVWKKTEKGRSYKALLRHKVPAGSLYDGFHSYGVSVERDWIIFYHDRVEVGRTATPPEHHVPMFILANLALGAGWPIEKAPSPSFMYIDHIRAYRKKFSQ